MRTVQQTLLWVNFSLRRNPGCPVRLGVFTWIPDRTPDTRATDCRNTDTLSKYGSLCTWVLCPHRHVKGVSTSAQKREQQACYWMCFIAHTHVDTPLRFVHRDDPWFPEGCAVILCEPNKSVLASDKFTFTWPCGLLLHSAPWFHVPSFSVFRIRLVQPSSACAIDKHDLPAKKLGVLQPAIFTSTESVLSHCEIHLDGLWPSVSGCVALRGGEFKTSHFAAIFKGFLGKALFLCQNNKMLKCVRFLCSWIERLVDEKVHRDVCQTRWIYRSNHINTFPAAIFKRLIVRFLGISAGFSFWPFCPCILVESERGAQWIGSKTVVWKVQHIRKRDGCICEHILVPNSRRILWHSPSQMVGVCSHEPDGFTQWRRFSRKPSPIVAIPWNKTWSEPVFQTWAFYSQPRQWTLLLSCRTTCQNELCW